MACGPSSIGLAIETYQSTMTGNCRSFCSGRKRSSDKNPLASSVQQNNLPNKIVILSVLEM
jgi:hypothetical protein